MDTEQKKRRARLKVAFKLMHIQYSGEFSPQPTEELTPAQHHYLRYSQKQENQAITRFCGCGTAVDHYGSMLERVHPCQVCRLFPHLPRPR